MLPHLKDYYATEGFTFMDAKKPDIGATVEAARVFVDRGFGGVILSTRRLLVQMTRRAEHEFYDDLNMTCVPCFEFEAWRVLPSNQA